MSVREVTYFQVVCDEPGCEFSTAELGSDYSAWSEAGHAIDEWNDSDQQEVESAGVTFYYCEEHRHPVCVECPETAGLVLDEPDGDLYCPLHLERLAAAVASDATTQERP